MGWLIACFSSARSRVTHRPRVNGEVTSVAAKAQPLGSIRAAARGQPGNAGFQDHRGVASDHRADRAGPRAEGHPVRHQHQEPRLQHVRARPPGLRQEHGRQSASGTEGCRVARRRPIGPMSTISTTPIIPRPCSCRPAARGSSPRAWSRPSTSCEACCPRCSKAKTIRCGGAPSTSSSAPATKRRWRR